jgi:hypothetical protein
MHFHFARGNDVINGVSLCFEVIRDQPAMTLPPQSFRTHDDRAFAAAELQQDIHRVNEIACRHVIGVATASRQPVFFESGWGLAATT